jgi:hypothetical protein
MANSNYLTEIKKEYTIQLVNMLTPVIYEGINSIYNEAKETATAGEELKMFQGFLSKVPTWTEQMINTEASRIKVVIPNADILDDLIKAVIQSNILLLTSTDISDKHKVLKEFNINLNYNKFIHNVYIEVAKTFYNYPFLFFHKMQAIEYKRNQLKSHKLIKEAIEEAIRKMLPLQLILKKYLGFMSETNDNKYIKSLVNTESNNQQYQLVNKNIPLNLTDTQNTGQVGGIQQSQPPFSLKEIYEQQLQQKNGITSTTPKHIPITESRNLNRSEHRNENRNEQVPTIIIPSAQQNSYNMVNKQKNNDSETSQPYHQQDGGIEEEFSNMKKNNFKPSLDTLSESELSTDKNRKNLHNYRKY